MSAAFFRGITRNVLILSLVSLLTDLSSQMVFPLIPLYMTSVLAAGAGAVGIVEGAAETTASLLKVFSGYLSDRVQRRKPFVLLGYSLSTFTKPLFAFANTWSLVLFIRVIERIGKGIRTAPRDAIVAESCEECVRGKVFGFHRTADGIGSTLGGVIAFALLAVMDFRGIFLLAFIPGALSVLGIFLVKEKPSPAPPPLKAEPLHLSLRALPKNLRLFIFISALFALGHFGYAFLLLKAKDIGLADDRAVLLYVVFYVIYTLCSIPSGALSDRLGRKPLLLGGYGVFALMCAGALFASEVWSLVLVFCTYGVFFAMIDGVQRAFVVDLAPPHLTATALGTFHTAIGLAALPGGFVAGLLWDHLQPEATFIYGLSLTGLSMGLFLFVKGRSGHPREQINPPTHVPRMGGMGEPSQGP